MPGPAGEARGFRRHPERSEGSRTRSGAGKRRWSSGSLGAVRLGMTGGGAERAAGHLGALAAGT